MTSTWIGAPSVPRPPPLQPPRFALVTQQIAGLKWEFRSRSRAIIAKPIRSTRADALEQDRKRWNVTTDAYVETQVRKLWLKDCRVALGLPPTLVSPALLAASDVALKKSSEFIASTGGTTQSGQNNAQLRATWQANADALKAAVAADNEAAVQSNLALLEHRLATDAGYQKYVADLEAAKRKLVAEQEAAERQRVADAAELKELRAEADMLLTKVSEFAKKDNAASRSLALVRLALALKSALSLGDLPLFRPTKVKALDEALAKDAAYQAFLVAEAKFQEEELARQRAELAGGLAILKAFATDYISKNLLTHKAPLLLTLVSDIEAALASKDDEKIKATRERATRVLQMTAVTTEYEAYVTATCGSRSLSGCLQVVEVEQPVPAVVEVVGEKDNPADQETPPPSVTGRKVALVIGNSAYQNANEWPRTPAMMPGLLRKS